MNEPDDWQSLVERVAAAPGFRKSNRLRELFLFLCERGRSDASAPPREQDIGVAVFGRRPDYDTSEDAIVRVQVSQLRKRLEQYFAAEGRDEPVVIEIPKGSYAPVARPRPEGASPEAPPVRRFSRLRYGLAAFVAVLAVATGFFVSGTRSGDDAVQRFWSQLFDNGRPTCVVLSDANLGLFEDAIRRQLTLNEYRNKEFTRLADERLADPVERERWKQLLPQFFTHISDARSSAAFLALSRSLRLPAEIAFAQDFGVAYLQSHNLVLLGTRRTNPWVELFEDQLNFHSGFNEAPVMTAYFENRAPQAGESATYTVRWRERGYCRVAFLPTPTRNGNALVISGTDMASSEAGGQFITTDRWIRALRSRLGLEESARFPHFEVLLKVDYVTWNTPTFEIAAWRKLHASR